MAKIRHMYPGGNTCGGFHSFYDHIVPQDCQKKIILKGGPGVGKSTFMKKIGQELSTNKVDVEYHWCSSDNSSLDGLVAGNGQICLVDGTSPHVVDPRFPGAVDYIINMGDFWDADLIGKNKPNIIKLTQQIGLNFERAYNRLKETQAAWWEWCSYYRGVVNYNSVNRNILALTADFVQRAPQTERSARHLFAAALTPEGIVSRIDSLIEKNWVVFAVKGSPGSGVKNLFQHIQTTLTLQGIYGEIFHCPFDPVNLDVIIIPGSKSALIDISGSVVDYEKYISTTKYKRMLDFDLFVDSAAIEPYSSAITAARERFQNGLQEAVAFIAAAKKLHDELETFYVPAMDFASVEVLRKTLTDRLLEELN